MRKQSTAALTVESRQHMLLFADRCVAVRFDDQDDTHTLRTHAIALSEAIHGAVRCVGALAGTLPDSNPERDVFIECVMTLVEFALGASIALQFDAYQTDKVENLDAVARARGAK